MLINPIDGNVLRQRVRSATPFPYVFIDDFLEERFAERVLTAFPSFDDALKMGRTFSAVNEKRKVQVTDPLRFDEPMAQLNQAISSPEFLKLLCHGFAIPDLLADDQLVGGGIHQTGPRGHLDVHIDFNYIPERDLHRRLNILIYFNKGWKDEWGGNIELWDEDVKICHHSFLPLFNRCVIFETSEISYHGVTAVRCPEGCSRKSFAAYYYTKEAPPHWSGAGHSTIFKARPHEVLKGQILMPLERACRRAGTTLRGVKRRIMGYYAGMKYAQ
jgi:hypothetical protein